jgi:hypothetical protein
VPVGRLCPRPSPTRPCPPAWPQLQPWFRLGAHSAPCPPGWAPQNPPAAQDERAKLKVKVDPASQRLQVLEPFNVWHGDDIKDAVVLIKVRATRTWLGSAHEAHAGGAGLVDEA